VLGQQRPGFFIGVGQLTCQRPDLATVVAVAQRVALQDSLAPQLQTSERVQPLKKATLPAQNLLGLVVDDRVDQRFLVSEVPIEL
jgi:hypothetical protein